MRPTHSTTPELDRLVMDRLPAAERAAVLEHVAACRRCADLHEERATAAVIFSRDVLPRTLPRTLRRVARARWWWRARWLAPVVACAVAVVLVVAPRARVRPELGVKGGGLLRVYARHRGEVTLVGDGTRLTPGDRIRFVVQSDFPYALVVSADGEGTRSVYLPHGGGASQAIPPRVPVEVPGSIELDGARGPERIWALFSRRPLAVAEVAAAIRAAGDLRKAATLAVPGAVQTSLLIEKEEERSRP
jgi:hypothetical protein